MKLLKIKNYIINADKIVYLEKTKLEESYVIVVKTPFFDEEEQLIFIDFDSEKELDECWDQLGL